MEKHIHVKVAILPFQPFDGMIHCEKKKKKKTYWVKMFDPVTEIRSSLKGTEKFDMYMAR